MLKKIFRLFQRCLHFYLTDPRLKNACIKSLEQLFFGGEVLICILHTYKTRHRVPYLVKHLKGNVDFFFYADYNDIQNNVFKVSNADYYESNEIKHINVLNIIRNSKVYSKYAFVFFMDDDTYINVQKLKDYVKSADKEKMVWIGQLLDIKNNGTNHVFHKWPKLQYMSGGAGYLLNSGVFNGPKFENHFTGYSDVSLGLNIQARRNVELVHDDRFRSQAPGYYKLSDEAFQTSISFHYIKSAREYASCAALVGNVMEISEAG